MRALRRLTASGPRGRERLPPVELRVYRIEASLLAMKLEPDEDIHLVIAQPGRPNETMIVEFPSENCTLVARPGRQRQMRRARAALVRACGLPRSSRFQLLEGQATISGVGFFDRIHGQHGGAPNGIELHPVLLIRVSRCALPEQG